jgi:hypothetical protein
MVSVAVTNLGFATGVAFVDRGTSCVPLANLSYSEQTAAVSDCAKIQFLYLDLRCSYMQKKSVSEITSILFSRIVFTEDGI